MQECNHCDNRSCHYLHSRWPELRDKPPKRAERSLALGLKCPLYKPYPQMKRSIRDEVYAKNPELKGVLKR